MHIITQWDQGLYEVAPKSRVFLVLQLTFSVSRQIIDSQFFWVFFKFPDVFLNNQLYWHYLYCLGFNLKKKSCRKSKYLKSTVEYRVFERKT